MEISSGAVGRSAGGRFISTRMAGSTFPASCLALFKKRPRTFLRSPVGTVGHGPDPVFAERLLLSVLNLADEERHALHLGHGLTASTRNAARSSWHSWPTLSSGTSTCV